MCTVLINALGITQFLARYELLMSICYNRNLRQTTVRLCTWFFFWKINESGVYFQDEFKFNIAEPRQASEVEAIRTEIRLR